MECVADEKEWENEGIGVFSISSMIFCKLNFAKREKGYNFAVRNQFIEI